jgi:hypothetical protein
MTGVCWWDGNDSGSVVLVECKNRGVLVGWYIHGSVGRMVLTEVCY